MVQVKHLEQCLVNCLLLFLFYLHGPERGRNLELLVSSAMQNKTFKKRKPVALSSDSVVGLLGFISFLYFTC